MGRTGTYIALAVMVLVGVLGGLASWASSGNASRPVEINYDRFMTNLTGNDPFTRCFHRTGEFGNPRTFVTEITIDDLGCYLPPTLFEGALIVEPEGYVFASSLGPQTTYSISCDPMWWYAIDGIVEGLPEEFWNGRRPEVWHARFIGRPSPNWHETSEMLAYGRWGLHRRAVVINRILLIRHIGHVNSDEYPNGIVVRYPINCDNPH